MTQNLTKLRPFTLFSYLVFGLFLLFLPGNSYYETLAPVYKPPVVQASAYDDFVPSLYPLNVGLEPQPQIYSSSAVVIDLESGVTLYSYEPEKSLRPASITKLMTAIVALDYYRPEEILVVKRLAPANGESEMGLSLNDRVSVRNLIYGLLVPSGNDAAYTFADNYPGGFENFVYSMNKKAAELGMKNTHFENPSGLDSQNHFTTVKDISIMAVTALKNKLISGAVATYGITLSNATGEKSYPMKNVNKFLGYLYGADGVKTGFTDLAGECLVASVSRGGHRVISVVLNSSDRFSDSARLLEWVYRNFRWVNPYENTY